jgi:four helix bundle protein
MKIPKSASIRRRDTGRSAERMALRAESKGNMKFRFQDLDIWRVAIDIGNQLFDIADSLEAKKLFRFAEQLRGAALSISNNIAEGSGSRSKKEFSQFLNYARRSVFENANILLVLQSRELVEEKEVAKMLDILDQLSRMITNFQKSLKG